MTITKKIEYFDEQVWQKVASETKAKDIAIKMAWDILHTDIEIQWQQ